MSNEQSSLQKVSKVTYQVISDIGGNTCSEQISTYGIQMLTQDCEEVIHDVSIDKQTVDRMAELFNEFQLSQCHFKDAVEDMLV